MEHKQFGEYIEFLRNNFGNLVEYKELAGTPSHNLTKVKTDLFHEDPFVVYGASIAATAEFANSNIYH